jgi:EAL domain-containing protein (putative c-di-GMP-specific phosphodiesterase class I)
VRFSVSFGVSIYPDDGMNAESLIRNSATALRWAKGRERGTVAFYRDTLGREADTWATLEQALNGAIERQELAIHYQPQVHAGTGRCVGAEALLRWTNPSLGSVPPNRFIPIAEASPLILAIGEWVINEACRQGASWRHGARDLIVSVNVSARQLKDDGFPAAVDRALSASNFPAHLLELEITESMLMEDADHMLARLNALKERGIRLAIDDFGTGYSNLGYLRRFRADRLKIDQSFVRGLPADAEARAISATIIQLGQSLNLSTIAEGVETEDQAEALATLGCHEFQGYYIGKPMPADQLSAWLAAQEG